MRMIRPEPLSSSTEKKELLTPAEIDRKFQSVNTDNAVLQSEGPLGHELLSSEVDNATNAQLATVESDIEPEFLISAQDKGSAPDELDQHSESRGAVNDSVLDLNIIDAPVDDSEASLEEQSLLATADITEDALHPDTPALVEEKKNAHTEVITIFSSLYKSVMVYPGLDSSLASQAIAKITRDIIDVQAALATEGVNPNLPHSFYAKMVSELWVVSLLKHGGAQEFPNIDINIIVDAIKTSLEYKPILNSGAHSVSHAALVVVTGNILRHLLDYKTLVAEATGQKVKIEVDWVLGELISQIKDSVTSLTATTEFNTEESHAALFAAANGFFETMWGKWRGSIYESIKGMGDTSNAVPYFKDDMFQQGFPVKSITKDLHDGIRQIMNTVTHVMNIKNKVE